jgi:hypothetical protein
MENLLATKFHVKVGEHLATIPGAISLHLDTPIVPMVVHGIPTSHPLVSLQEEPTTYNPGLVVSSTPQSLTQTDQCRKERASSVMITLAGNKAQDVTSRTCLFTLSATLRTERELHFDPCTQCAKCQQFGPIHYQVPTLCLPPLVCRKLPYWGTLLPSLHLLSQWL